MLRASHGRTAQRVGWGASTAALLALAMAAGSACDNGDLVASTGGAPSSSGGAGNGAGGDRTASGGVGSDDVGGNGGALNEGGAGGEPQAGPPLWTSTGLVCPQPEIEAAQFPAGAQFVTTPDGRVVVVFLKRESQTQPGELRVRIFFPGWGWGADTVLEDKVARSVIGTSQNGEVAIAYYSGTKLRFRYLDATTSKWVRRTPPDIDASLSTLGLDDAGNLTLFAQELDYVAPGDEPFGDGTDCAHNYDFVHDQWSDGICAYFEDWKPSGLVTAATNDHLLILRRSLGDLQALADHDGSRTSESLNSDTAYGLLSLIARGNIAAAFWTSNSLIDGDSAPGGNPKEWPGWMLRISLFREGIWQNPLVVDLEKPDLEKAAKVFAADTDGEGQALVVSPGQDPAAPDLSYRYFDGTAWTTGHVEFPYEEEDLIDSGLHVEVRWVACDESFRVAWWTTFQVNGDHPSWTATVHDGEWSEPSRTAEPRAWDEDRRRSTPQGRQIGFVKGELRLLD